MTLKTLLPGTTGATGQQLTLGVMGGGQLGRMFVHQAQAMGYFTAVLDADPDSPASCAALATPERSVTVPNTFGLWPMTQAVSPSTAFASSPSPSMAAGS